MEKFYFTYGSWEKFPYQNTYIIVKALDRSDAVATYRKKYPDINADTVCCSDIYNEVEWQEVVDFYKDKQPAKILVSVGYIQKLISVKSERLIALSDGTSMGDSLLVFFTNAPETELQKLEKISCDIYKGSGSGGDVPIWKDFLEDKGYVFEYVDEHQHVSAFSTSSEWLENTYPFIKEHYVIENQPNIEDESKKLIAIFIVAKELYELYGNIDICYGKDYNLKEYSYPEFNDLSAKKIEGNKCCDFIPEGVRWVGTEYTEEDMISDLLFKRIIGSQEYEILYLDKALINVVNNFQEEKIVLDNLDLPFRILGRDMYQVFELLLVTDRYIYYGCGEDILMFDMEGFDIISDNYFASVGYTDSCENIQNGQEKLLWAYKGFNDDNKM